MGELGDPDLLVRVEGVDLADVRGQAAEVAVPVHGHEVEGAARRGGDLVAGRVEVAQPVDSAFGPCRGWEGEF